MSNPPVTLRSRKVIVEELRIIPLSHNGRPRSFPDLLSLSLLDDDDSPALDDPTGFHVRYRSYEEETTFEPLPPVISSGLASSSEPSLKTVDGGHGGSQGGGGGGGKRMALSRKTSLPDNPLLDEVIGMNGARFSSSFIFGYYL